MTIYEHGVRVTEKPTTMPSDVVISAGVQFIVGTAAVNQAAEVCLNTPLLINNMQEAKEKLGYNLDMSYTANQVIYSNLEVHRIAPFVFVNILDPRKHKKVFSEQIYDVIDKQVIIERTGIINDAELVIKKMPEDTVLNQYTDFLLSFDDNGYLIIDLVGTAVTARQLKVKGNILDVSKVEQVDVIGSYDSETGVRTGLECIEEVYPKYNIIPSLILIPGYSQEANVAMAMTNKCEGLNGVFRAECLIDLDTAKIHNVTDVEKLKKAMALNNPHQFLLYPMVKRDDKVLYYSALMGALMSAMARDNGGTPEDYVSNKALKATALCDEAGREINLDTRNANQINGYGVITAIRSDGKIVAWGVETAAYPNTKDPKDRFTGIRRMFTFIDNIFITSSNKYTDSKMSKVAADNLITNFNIFGNSLVANGKVAGLSVERLAEDNQVSSILEGINKVRIHLAAYPPMRFIDGVIEYDYETVVTELTS